MRSQIEQSIAVANLIISLNHDQTLRRYLLFTVCRLLDKNRNNLNCTQLNGQEDSLHQVFCHMSQLLSLIPTPQSPQVPNRIVCASKSRVKESQ